MQPSSRIQFHLETRVNVYDAIRCKELKVFLRQRQPMGLHSVCRLRLGHANLALNESQARAVH